MQNRYSLLAIALLGLFTLATPITAQEVAAEEVVEKPDTLGIHPWRYFEPVAPTLAHWSVYLDAGFNVFDGDFHYEMGHPVYVPSLGVGFEYNFNCTWGIGAEYHFDNYQVSGDGEVYKDVVFKGLMHRADAFITFDIFNAWRPQNQFKLFALNLMVGGGPVWYRNVVVYGEEVPYADGIYTKVRKDSEEEPTPDKDYRTGATFMGGVSFEFNVTRELQVGLRTTYNYFTKDNIDFRNTGNSNDGIFDVDLVLRWKIEGRKKSHVRNMAHTDIAKGRNEPDYSDLCDKCNWLKDTLVISHVDTLYIISEAPAPAPAPRPDTIRVLPDHEGDYHYVYFANDDATIDETGQRRIQEVANILHRDTTLCVEVSAYCDNTGSEGYNIDLSDRRAKNVRAELIQEHGIRPERVQFISNGIQQTRRTTGSYAPNRRAEMHVMREADFNAKYGKGDKRIQETVRMLKGQTLRQLSRKYYNGNPACWVYIYQENAEKITDPNDLPVGSLLRIPALSDEDKKITEEEASRKFKAMTESKEGLDDIMRKAAGKAIEKVKEAVAE